FWGKRLCLLNSNAAKESSDFDSRPFSPRRKEDIYVQEIHVQHAIQKALVQSPYRVQPFGIAYKEVRLQVHGANKCGTGVGYVLCSCGRCGGVRALTPMRVCNSAA